MFLPRRIVAGGRNPKSRVCSEKKISQFERCVCSCIGDRPMLKILRLLDILLVGGFNPFAKYESKWIISPCRDENKQYLKPPPRFEVLFFLGIPGLMFALDPGP